MSDYTKYKRGSVWRKWDLHIHTPYSIHQKYGANDNDTWDKFIADLEKLSSEFAVLGINDYLFIDGYERINKERKEKNILPNIHKIFPVVEFRIEKFAGINFEKFKRINLHVIFSDEVPIETIKSQFLNTLEQSYCLEDGEKWTRAITRESVEDLGKQIKLKVPATELHKYGSDLTEGFNNLNLKEERIFESLKKDCFEGKYLIAIGKTEWADLKWSDASIATKKSIINSADIIFTAAASPDEHKKAKEQLNRQGVKDLLLDCSDAHNFSNSTEKDRISNCFNWIKADPTFEGLKQIIYEPKDRICVQDGKPEEKTGYQAIDRIEVNHPAIYNSSIPLNQNLTSIIGGRSTGKSVLLAAIAKKLKTDKPVTFAYKLDYENFVNDISKSLTIFWKDGIENDDREIEYFEQGYMYELARKEDTLSELIEEILKQKGKEIILNNYSKFVADNNKKISDLISDFFRLLKDIKDKEQKITEKGDKKGIEDEIKKLTEELKKLNVASISDEEKGEYEKIKEEIQNFQHTQTIINNDLININALKVSTIFKDNLIYELASISESRKSAVDKIFTTLKTEFELKWVNYLDEIITETKKQEETVEQQLKTLNENPTFLKVLSAYKEVSQLTELETKVKIQKDKLFEITQLFLELNELTAQKDKIKEGIITAHKLYYEKTSEITPNLLDVKDGLEIKAKVKFNQKKYSEILNSALNQQGYLNQSLSSFNHSSNEQYEKYFNALFDRLIRNEITLKGAYNQQSFATTILSECFYYLNYDIEYEGDDFQKMSEGKKAFVVLKLLLDFSNKECPILIDQPEDDLDNRAIYLDLVQYLKKKKTQRQIIIATHNPNIVVGADSELVIVANQHGIKNANKDNKKFQYVSGSLENTLTKNVEVIEVLTSQGIREHVCEILEGGDIAFKLREKKYAIK